MSYAIFGLFYSTISSFLLMLGTGCFINKSGDFFKVLSEESDDNFKRAFDHITNDLMEDFSKTFVSMNLITNNVSKIMILAYELMIGEKIIKKTKDGKIMINDKNIIFDNYENKISKLSEKVKNYKNILENMKNENKIEFELDEDLDDNDDNDDNDNKENNSDSDGDEEIEEINADN
jgi:hypothetical protein